jgi:lysophospholipase L1-like esterase
MPARRTAVPALTAALVAALALAACGGEATVADQHRPGAHVAVGDSVAAGAGDPDGGYVARLVPALEAVTCGGQPCPELRTTNLAVGGATTASLLADQLEPATSALRDSGEPRLVTVTIGGNDVVEPLARACAGGVTDQCATAARDRYEQVRRNLDRILADLRAAAGNGATIAVMTYYNSFQACDLSVLAPLADRVLDGDDAVGVPSFNALLAEVATARGAVVVPTRDRIGPEQLVGGGDCLHPNADGHEAIAQAFAEAVGPALAEPEREQNADG